LIKRQVTIYPVNPSGHAINPPVCAPFQSWQSNVARVTGSPRHEMKEIQHRNRYDVYKEWMRITAIIFFPPLIFKFRKREFSGKSADRLRALNVKI
jgi:hypothetical protein